MAEPDEIADITAPGAELKQAGMAAALGTATLAPTAAGEVELAARARLGVAGWLGIAWMAFVVAAAVLAPILPIDDPNALGDQSLAPPGPDHWFGTDGTGRDLFSRVIWGGRASLLVGTASVAIGMLVGGTLGLVAGYARGWSETVLVTVFDTLLAFPQLVLALSLVAILASDPDVSSARRMVVLILALGIVGIPILGRITRANTLVWSQREFVTAARALGARTRRVVWREVLPNVLPAMFSIGLLGVAVAIVAEGGLSLLGVGVQLPTPSWGNIIAENRGNVAIAPNLIAFPTIFIFLTVLALNYLGDVVRARFDVREAGL
jgi:peptide/nickel transport system permease protein